MEFNVVKIGSLNNPAILKNFFYLLVLGVHQSQKNLEELVVYNGVGAFPEQVPGGLLPMFTCFFCFLFARNSWVEFRHKFTLTFCKLDHFINIGNIDCITMKRSSLQTGRGKFTT